MSDDAQLAAIRALLEKESNSAHMVGGVSWKLLDAGCALLRMLEEANVRMLRDEERVENAERAWNAALTERDELRAKLADVQARFAALDAVNDDREDQTRELIAKLAEAEKRIDKLKEALTDALTLKASSARDYEEEYATRRQFQEANREHFAMAENAKRCNANLVSQLADVTVRAEVADARVKEVEAELARRDDAAVNDAIRAALR